MDIAILVYRFTALFPKEEKFGLISQIQRCAVSIASNIAEGSGRVSKKEFQHFISISMGSCFELETQMILAYKFNYITEIQLHEFTDLIATLQKMTFGLYNSLEK